MRFVYALAPFHNDGEARGKHFRFDTEEHYQKDLKELKAKYMQTIDAGVRQIALLADDSTDWGAQYGNDNTYVRVLKDLTDWIHELQQEKNDDGTAKYEASRTRSSTARPCTATPEPVTPGTRTSRPTCRSS